MHETRQLAEFVATTHFANLPSSLIEDFKIIVLDTLAAGMIGTAQPWAKMVVELVHELGGNQTPRSSTNPGAPTSPAPPWPMER